MAIAVAVLAATSAEPQRSDLDRVRSDITRLRNRLEQVRRQAESAQRSLEEVEIELGIHTRELELATDVERRLSDAQTANEARIAALIQRIDQQKVELRKRLVVLYRLGRLSYIRLLLAIEEDRHPVDAMSMLGYLVSRDARLVSQFQTTRHELDVQNATLADQRQRVAQARVVVEERRRAVAVTVAQRQRALSRLRAEESGAAEELAALEEKARRLQRLVDVLLLQKRGLDPQIDIRTVQGALSWPVEGTVVEAFGRQRNPKFATYTVNNGLKIEAAPGTPVRAVFAGTVLFSQWFKGYGNLIILDHGNRVFSLYGNLKAPQVAVGDRIVTGQTIAAVGEGEEATGGHLYFEIRHDNHPEDPQTWLR